MRTGYEFHIAKQLKLLENMSKQLRYRKSKKYTVYKPCSKIQIPSSQSL